jgi:MoaA/NifB/PqqE/SkfB family radical SAM enzyme
VDSLRLIITSRCNLSCTTCLRYSDESHDLDFETLVSVLKQAKALGCKRLTLTGGEPCLHPRFRDIVQYIDRNGFKLQMVTNGSHIECYQYLLTECRQSLGALFFSLDGATAAVHDKNRGSGSFDQVISSIAYTTSQGCVTCLQTCITRLNMHQLEDMVTLGIRHGISAHAFLIVIPTKGNRALVLSDQEREDIGVELNQLARKYPKRISCMLNMVDPATADYCSELITLDMLGVNWSGELVLCCGSDRTETALGSLAHEPLEVLYQKAQSYGMDLRRRKAQAIAENSPDRMLGSCEFCNKHLAEKKEKELRVEQNADAHSDVGTGPRRKPELHVISSIVDFKRLPQKKLGPDILISLRLSEGDLSPATGEIIISVLEDLTRTGIHATLARPLPRCVLGPKYYELVSHYRIPQSCADCSDLYTIIDEEIVSCEVIGSRGPKIRYLPEQDQIAQYHNLLRLEKTPVPTCRVCMHFRRNVCDGKCFRK